MHRRIYTPTHEQDVGAGAAVGHHFDGEPPPPSILDELRKLRDENRQLRHEKSAWADTQKAIERDLAAADSEAQQASRRIEDLERELRKQSGWVTARINIATCTPYSFASPHFHHSLVANVMQACLSERTHDHIALYIALQQPSGVPKNLPCHALCLVFGVEAR